MNDLSPRTSTAMSAEGELVEDQTQQEQANPEVRARIRASFDRQGLMSHLGARITRIAAGRVSLSPATRVAAVLAQFLLGVAVTQVIC